MSARYLIAGTLTAMCLAVSANAQKVSQVVNAIVATTCTNQFVRSIAASGAGTCATVGSSDIASSVTLAGSPTAGGGSGSVVFSVNGGNTNAGDGAALFIRAAGVTTSAIGNASSVLGGAYDATAIWYGGTNAMAIRGSNTVGCGAGLQTAPTTGVISCVTSSARFKHDIHALDQSEALAIVMRLKPSSWTYNEHAGLADDGQAAVGLVAEDVAEADPRIAGYDGDGRPLTIRPDRIVGVLVAVIQQQQKRIEALERKQ